MPDTQRPIEEVSASFRENESYLRTEGYRSYPSPPVSHQQPQLVESRHQQQPYLRLSSSSDSQNEKSPIWNSTPSFDSIPPYLPTMGPPPSFHPPYPPPPIPSFTYLPPHPSMTGGYGPSPHHVPSHPYPYHHNPAAPYWHPHPPIPPPIVEYITQIEPEE